MDAQGCKPQLLPFPPYTCAQIGAVLRARLSQLPGKVFTLPAVMLCARKVCSHRCHTTNEGVTAASRCHRALPVISALGSTQTLSPVGSSIEVIRC